MIFRCSVYGGRQTLVAKFGSLEEVIAWLDQKLAPHGPWREYPYTIEHLGRQDNPS